MKKFFVYQEKDDYIQLLESFELERPRKADADRMKEKYGNLYGYIYHGWDKDVKNICGWLYVKDISPLRKVKTYILKDKKL